ncbi:MAG: pseudouridine synthase [Bacteroidia bacterium]
MAKRADSEPRKSSEKDQEPVKKAKKEVSAEEFSEIKPVSSGAKKFSFTPRTEGDNTSDKGTRPARRKSSDDDSFDKPSKSFKDDSDQPYEKKERKDGRRNLKKEGGGFKKVIGDSSFPKKEESSENRPAKSYSREKDGGDFKKRSGDSDYPKKRESNSDRPVKPYSRDKDGEDFKKKSEDSAYPKKRESYSDRPAKPYSRDKKEDSFEDKKPGRRPRTSEKRFERDTDKPKPWEEKPSFSKPYDKGDKFEKRPERKPRSEDDAEKGEKKSGFRDYEKDDRPLKRPIKPARFEKSEHSSPERKGGDRSEWMDEVPASWKQKRTYKSKKTKEPTLEDKDGKIRLNKYISNAGICSRREADELIKSGAVKVNGKIITEMGHRISATDKVQYGDETLSKEVKRYLLLNKPKDYITTANDPGGRKTVMELIQKACKERLYPVGRLDRATTGLLLFTNDGELARKLTHPSQEIKKVYHVTLSKNLKAIDMKRIMEGLELEDGKAEVDAIDWTGEGKDKNEVGIELHSGKNRIVRRIFEHLGYEVVKLDRTFFAGLNKKDLPRGNFRFLTEKEVVLLRMT